VAANDVTPVSDEFEAFVVRAEGEQIQAGVETLTLDDLPDGNVTVSVTWSSVNYKDGIVTVPGNRVARISPLVPGVDLAGVVAESDDPEFEVGTQVLAHGHDIGVARHGGFAAVARMPSAWLVRIPEGLSPRQTMAIGTAGFTAALSIDELERRGLRPPDGPVIVTGASGGVGSMSVALLARRGYEVEASTGRTEEEPWLRSLGAARVLGRDELDESPSRVLGPERWAAGIDCVGGATLHRVLRSLAYGGAVAASGLTGGTELSTSVYPFITRQVALLGIDSVATPRQRRQGIWQRLASDLRLSHIESLVEEEVDLAGLPDALQRILQGRVRGRIVVDVGR
jgi:acrylyl-CoA reductase (NADPH)